MNKLKPLEVPPELIALRFRELEVLFQAGKHFLQVRTLGNLKELDEQKKSATQILQASK